MKEINASINIHENQYETIADAIYDYIEDRLRDDVERNIDFDIPITEWMNDNFNIRDYIESDIEEYIDFESAAQNLLSNYNPSTSCTTGKIFTEAVGKAIRYIFLKDHEMAEDIKRAMNTFDKISARNNFLEEEEAALKEKHFAEFKRELELLQAQNYLLNNNNIYPPLIG